MDICSYIQSLILIPSNLWDYVYLGVCYATAIELEVNSLAK